MSGYGFNHVSLMVKKIVGFKNLLGNLTSLVILNIVNYLFPIIIIPILITRLGLEIYGKYIFAFTVLSYLNLIVQYGFNFSATKRVAQSQEDFRTLSDTYTSVTVIRLLFSTIITLILVFLSFIMGDGLIVYLMGIGIFFGQGLIPVWLFQGLEKMRYITIVNALVRVIAFVLIYLLVINSNDVNLLMFIQTLSFIIGGILSIILVHYQLRIRFVRPQRHLIIQHFREGWTLFTSTVGMNLYRESNVLILGIVAGYTTVGLYSPAEKLVKGIQSFTNIIVTALFPHFSKVLTISGVDGLASFAKTGKVLGILFATSTILMVSFSALIINFYLGEGYFSTITDFRILSLIIFFGGLNYFYGIVGMVNFNKQDLFNRLVWITGLIGIGLSFVLSFYFRDIGAAVAMVIAEVVLFVLVIRNVK